MLIDIFISLFVLGAVGSLCSIVCSRSSKLSRLAQNYGCNFDRQKSTVTTPLSAGKTSLFSLFFHQFHNVFTFTTRTAFIRLSDDSIFLDDQPKTKPLIFSLFSAEMRKTQFPTLKIIPLHSPLAVGKQADFKTNVPQIDTVYHIQADSPQAKALLSPFMMNILKENSSLYLEADDAVFVYHEHTLVAPEQLEDLRFRGMKILNELELVVNRFESQQTAAAAQPAASPQAENLHVEQRAEAMLQAFASTRPQAPNPPSQNFRIFGLLLVLALFLGITFLSWFALHHWVGH